MTDRPRNPLPPSAVREGFLRGFDLDGRNAIVYGAESPLGSAVTAALREAGATVGVTSATTDGSTLFQLKQAAAGGPAEAVDLTNAANVQVATRKLQKDLGGLDIAIVVPSAYFAAPIARTDDTALDRMIAGNLVATYNVFRSAARELTGKRPDGRLIAILGPTALRGLANTSAFSAAQTAVLGLVRSLALELGPRGLTVNAIVTGWRTDSPGRGPDPPAKNELLRRIPMRRFASPDDITPLVVYLSSTAAGFISGSAISIDGGVMRRV